MKDNYEVVKSAVYTGMSIFYFIKDYDLIVGKKETTLEEKKFLSLYFGVITTKNDFSTFLIEKGINFNLNYNYKFLEREKYLDIYNKYFVDIFTQIDFNSIQNYVDYLLDKEIIQKYNRFSGHYNDIMISKNHKNKVKIIK